MDRNTLLAVGLSLLVISTWMTWDASQRKRAVEGGTTEGSDTTLLEAPGPGSPLSEEDAALFGKPSPVETHDSDVVATSAIQEWTVDKPAYRVVLSSRGAVIREWILKGFVTRPAEGGELVRLIEAEVDGGAFATPFPELEVGNLSRAAFELVEQSADRWVFEHVVKGLRIRKIFDFSAPEGEEYTASLTLALRNDSGRAVRPKFGLYLPVRVRAGADFRDAKLAVLERDSLKATAISSLGRAGILGAVLGRETGLQRFESDVQWLGVSSRFFLSAVVPKISRSAGAEFRAIEAGAVGVGVIEYPDAVIPQGGSLEYEYELYGGPKSGAQLKAVDERLGSGMLLERSVDRGWFWVAPLTDGFSTLLAWGYQVIPNYGVVIILLTILLRLAMAPLTVKQMRAMKKNSSRMGQLQPKMKAIQEKYKDDSQRRNEETMKLYKEAGVNPLTMMGGGCLPMLLQLPVFVALYYALQSSIDLRQAPFVLWIHDLSIPETAFTIPGIEIPVRILPLAMGASMVLQQKMTPSPSMDPAQARMMMTMMPIMFTVLFYGFPAGLVLYWFVSNLLAIGQQYWVNRGVAPAA